MARAGSFTGGRLPSLNPFGSSGGFAQYDIGKTKRELAEARRYEVEVRWANGQATDEEYLAVLREAIEVADPDSIEKISAQNKLDDAVFRIGRNRAEATGDPEALIAFDTAALASMNPNSLRYRELSQTLAAELANRRSRQYGDLVDRYNSGQSTTESLLAWVDMTLAGLPPNAPDRDNWEQTRRELTERVQAEKDTQAFQDYQQHRTSDADYLAFLTMRRNQYLTGSPQYAEWQRRLEDAQDSIKQKTLLEEDSIFFDGTEAAQGLDGYNNGGKTDQEYLDYIDSRLAKMDPDDPQRNDWMSRKSAAIFTITEDVLRGDVVNGRRRAKDLVAFYDARLKTVVPGSAEHRRITGLRDEAANLDLTNDEARIRFAIQYGIPIENVPKLGDKAAVVPPGNRVGAEPGGGVVPAGAAPGSAAPGPTFKSTADILKALGPNYRLSQDYSASHDAMDFAAPEGTPIYALADGVVTYAANDAEVGRAVSDKHNATRGGNTINIRGANGTFQYAHQQKFAPGIKVGSIVKAGDLIGFVGHTGAGVTGNHLHVGFLDNTNHWVSPLSYGGPTTTPAVSQAGAAPAVGPAPKPDKNGNYAATPANLEYMASKMLAQWNAPDTLENRRAVAAWIKQESGTTIRGNNPLNLHVSSGKTRTVASSGEVVGVFDSLDAGIAANARNLMANRSGYPAALAALRAGNPSAFYDALAASQWSEKRYGGAGGPNLRAAYTSLYGGTVPTTATTPVPAPAGTTPAPATTGTTPAPATTTTQPRPANGNAAGTTPPGPGARQPGTPTPVQGPATTHTGTYSPYGPGGGPLVIEPVARRPQEVKTEVNKANVAALIVILEQQLSRLPEGSNAWIAKSGEINEARQLLNAPDVPPEVDPQWVGDEPKHASAPRLDAALAQSAIDASSSPHAVATHRANLNSLQTAHTAGEDVWLFIDPANPNATTYARNPDGSYWVDPVTGQRQVVRGSFYLPVTDEGLARLQVQMADYYNSLSTNQAIAGYNEDSIKSLDAANNWMTTARGTNARIARDHLAVDLAAAKLRYSQAMGRGDLTAARNAAWDQVVLLTQISQNQDLTPAERDKYLDDLERASNNSLLPEVNDDGITERENPFDPAKVTVKPRPDGNGVTYEGGSDTLKPNHHLVFDTADGKKTFAHEAEDPQEYVPGEWDRDHVNVHVKFGDRVVTAAARTNDKPPISPLVRVSVDTDNDGVGDTEIMVQLDGQTAFKSIAFFDEDDVIKYGYTLDGERFIIPTNGAQPQTELGRVVKAKATDKNGVTQYVFVDDGSLAFFTSGDGVKTPARVITQPGQAPPMVGSLQFYGQGAADAALSGSPFGDARTVALYNSGTATKQDIIDSIAESERTSDVASGLAPVQPNVAIGAPGTRMTYVTRNPGDGSINALPPSAVRLRPESWIGQTGGDPSVNDILGLRGVGTIIQETDPVTGVVTRRAATPIDVIMGRVPGIPAMTPTPELGPPTGDEAIRGRNLVATLPQPGVGFAFTPDAAIAAQLPTGTPNRIEGQGFGPVGPKPTNLATPTPTSSRVPKVIPTPQPPQPPGAIKPIKPVVPPQLVHGPSVVIQPPPPKPVVVTNRVAAEPINRPPVTAAPQPKPKTTATGLPIPTPKPATPPQEVHRPATPAPAKTTATGIPIPPPIKPPPKPKPPVTGSMTRD